jgi:peptidoglycan/xylan/chitin deacetylase (PgdA/CDA1 family)
VGIDPPVLSESRGAPRRAQRRRRRRLAALGGLLVAAAAVLVVVLGDSGAASRSSRHAALAPAEPAVRSESPTRAELAPEGAAGATIRRLVRLGLPVYCGGSHGNEVAFTFDDGPGTYTYLALRKLTRAHERATFFVVGRNIAPYPGYLRRELQVAAIGDHTYTHPELTALSPDMVTWQLQATRQAIEAHTGVRVDLFRPPYELHDATVDRIARRLGLLEILWDVDSQDSLGANYAGIIRNVEAGLRPGAIILMHENRGQTIRALTTLLPELRRRRLRSVSVPELLASDPPSERQLRAGVAGCAAPGRIRPGLGG